MHEAVLRREIPAGVEAVEHPLPSRGNLPARTTSFVGREEAVKQVHRLLGRARMVTLTGPGGAGKTRLAVEAADRLAAVFPDGAWLVELDRVTPSAAVASAVARVLDAGSGAALAGGGGGPLEALVTALAQRISGHLQAALGDEALGAAWKEGRSLTPQEAITMARERLGLGAC